MTVPDISVVTTMYCSRPFLEAFLSGTLSALGDAGCTNYEIVLVNDGSPDDSLQYALTRRTEIRNLVVVDLSRNFGHHAAMQAGLSVARGNFVFLIDCDLEVSPSVLGDLLRRLRETGADVVYGFQSSRKGGTVEKIGGGLFWQAFNSMSSTKVPDSVLTERVMTRRFVDAFLRMGDHNLFFAGMMSWVGFVQVGVPIEKGLRKGASTYTFAKRLRLLVDAVTSFTATPLHWLFNTGALVTLSSFGYGAFLVIRRFFFDDTLLGFTSIMALLALTLGVLTMAIGLVGIYLGRVFTQVQDRPNFIIKDLHR